MLVILYIINSISFSSSCSYDNCTNFINWRNFSNLPYYRNTWGINFKILNFVEFIYGRFSQDCHKKMIFYMVLSFIAILIQFFGLFNSANTTSKIVQILFILTLQIYSYCVIYSLYCVIINRNHDLQDSYLIE
jgi:hypothetical protein